MNDNMSWHAAAKEYLTRLCREEWIQQGCPVPKRANSRKYIPSDYVRQLVDCLNKNDEERFKAIKSLQGYCSVIGV